MTIQLSEAAILAARNHDRIAAEWEGMMIAAGWQPRRDRFGSLVGMYHPHGARIEGSQIGAWRNLGRVPPRMGEGV